MTAPDVSPIPKYIYVCNLEGFWRLTDLEWIALCRAQLADPAPGYDLSPYRRLKRPPKGFRKNRDRTSLLENSYRPPLHLQIAAAYVEPLDWEPDAFRAWLVQHGVPVDDGATPSPATVPKD